MTRRAEEARKEVEADASTSGTSTMSLGGRITHRIKSLFLNRRPRLSEDTSSIRVRYRLKARQKAELTRRVFEDPNIVTLIMQHVFDETDFFSNFLKYRTVSRTINFACLHIMRKEFKRMCIYSDEEPEHFVINRFKFEFKYLLASFRFLRQVVNVFIQGIGFQEWMCTDSKLHGKLMAEIELFDGNFQLFTGVDQICPDGCDACSRMALRTTQTFGPITKRVLQSLKNPKNYRLLYITHVLLEDLANIASRGSKSREETMRNVMDQIKNVRAQRLGFLMSDGYDYTDGIAEYPMEVFKALLEHCRPSEIYLRLVGDVAATQNEWMKSGHFELLRFDGLNRDLSQVYCPPFYDHGIDLLVLDLYESAEFESLFDDYLRINRHPYYAIVTNFLRMFNAQVFCVDLPLYAISMDNWSPFLDTLITLCWHNLSASYGKSVFLNISMETAKTRQTAEEMISDLEELFPTTYPDYVVSFDDPRARCLAYDSNMLDQAETFAEFFATIKDDRHNRVIHFRAAITLEQERRGVTDVVDNGRVIELDDLDELDIE